MARHKHPPRPPSHPRDGRPAPPAAARRHDAAGTWLYGWHPVHAALANPRRHCRRLLVTAAVHERLGDLLAATAQAFDVTVVGRDEIDRLLPAGAVHQGAALLADPLPPVSLESACREPLPADAIGVDAVVILDQPSDPQNVGAVLRSAAAFGARAVIVPDRHAPEVTPVLAKAASGAVDRLPLVRVVNLARALGELKDWGFWCIGFDAEGGAPLWQADLKGRVALVMGSEGDGLRRLTRETCDLLAAIPLAPGSDSINLSAATAIALYETARARR